MRRLTNAIVATSVASLLCPTLAAQDALAIKRRLEEFGSGADVKLRFADGSKRRGLVGQMRADGFNLRPSRKGVVRTSTICRSPAWSSADGCIVRRQGAT